jgi:predicted lysophospholipase L1 biosynthesis ABC-type transport system permease subunit
VGVVASERQEGLASAARIEVYEPHAQDEGNLLSLVVRTRANPAAAAPAIRRTLAEMDREVAPFAVRTMEEVRAGSIARQQFLMALLLLFAGIALVLAVIGVYGVTAQMARQRTQEIGVRLALGAQRGDVLGLVVRHGLRLMTGGVVVGVGVALFASKAMRALLYDIEPTDPLTFAAVAALLALAGVADARSARR